MLKKTLSFISLLILTSTSYAVEPVLQPIQTNQINQTISPTAPQNIMFQNCIKKYSMNNEKLFYLTLSALSANKFTIDEIQTNDGYIIFTANKKQFLATIIQIDKNTSMIKITPCNNVYTFPSGIITNTFRYIDLNLNTEIKG